VKISLPLCSRTARLNLSKSKSKLYYAQRSVGQSVLVSGTHLGRVTNFFNYLNTVTALLMWGALSDERTDLQIKVSARLASDIFPGSESSEINGHILLSGF
jgi:hypothetical protein